MAIAKPDLTLTEFNDQMAALATQLPFTSDEQKWGIVYAAWKYNQANPEATKTITEYVELVVGGAATSYYTSVIADKREWIAELSASPEMTAVLIAQAQLPENSGLSLSEIASGLPFLFNV